MVINTWFIGMVMDMNTTDGYCVWNFKTVLHWTIGWLLGVNRLNLSSFSISLWPTGSFFPMGFDAPMLGFYLHFTNQPFYFAYAFFFSKRGGV